MIFVVFCGPGGQHLKSFRRLSQANKLGVCVYASNKKTTCLHGRISTITNANSSKNERRHEKQNKKSKKPDKNK